MYILRNTDGWDSKFCKEWPLGKREWANEKNALAHSACLVGSSIYRSKWLFEKSSGTGTSNLGNLIPDLALANRQRNLWREQLATTWRHAWAAVFQWLVQPSVYWKSHNLVPNLNQRAWTASVGCATSQIVVLCGWSDSIRSWVVAPPALEGKFSNFEGGIRLLVQQALQALPERLG